MFLTQKKYFFLFETLAVFELILCVSGRTNNAQEMISPHKHGKSQTYTLTIIRGNFMKIRHVNLHFLTIAILLTTTHPAFALSCARPDPVQICQLMHEQQLSPIWANGEMGLSKIISQEENEGSIGGKGAAVADYTFSGTLTDESGVRSVKNAALRISTSCAGPWCASLPSDDNGGYYLLEPNGKSGMKLHIGPCTFLPYSVTDKEKKEIEACVQAK